MSDRIKGMTGNLFKIKAMFCRTCTFGEVYVTGKTFDPVTKIPIYRYKCNSSSCDARDDEVYSPLPNSFLKEIDI